MKALLLENVHPLGEALLREAGFEVDMRIGAMDEDELIEALQGVDLLGIRSKTEVSARVLDNAPDLQAIGAFCARTRSTSRTPRGGASSCSTHRSPTRARSLNSPSPRSS